MPTYRLIHPETGEVEDYLVRVSEYQAMKEQGFVQVLASGSGGIISGRDHSGHGGGHGTSDGWKDVLRRIKSNNPGSTIDV
tara:strand:- start:1356 stop:1598 length:243 start_codon:yes stop_codon:yes gene_type:complete